MAGLIEPSFIVPPKGFINGGGSSDLPPLFLPKKEIASHGESTLGSPAPRRHDRCAVSSVVEHLPDTEGVTGSNPVSRTILIVAINQSARFC